MKKKKLTQGGKRMGAGRKPQYAEKTTTVAFRVPVSKVGLLKKLVAAFLKKFLKQDTMNEKYKKKKK